MPSHATLVAVVLALLGMIGGAALFILTTMSEITRDLRGRVEAHQARIEAVEGRAHDHRLEPPMPPGVFHDNP